MTLGARAVGAAVAVAVAFGVAWISNAAMTPPGAGEAILRLSWSARPERVEVCRTQSEAELARVPAHMRQPVVCEGSSAVYRLEVLRNGALVLQEPVRGGGLRHDRPMYVFRELPQPAGEAVITVRFVRADAPSGTAGSPATARNASVIPDVPASLVFERRIQFQPGRVVLVTYEPSRRELFLQGGQILN